MSSYLKTDPKYLAREDPFNKIYAKLYFFQG